MSHLRPVLLLSMLAAPLVPPIGAGASEDDPRPDARAEADPILEFRILANRRHDAAAIEEALMTKGFQDPPEGYRWVRIVGDDVATEGGDAIVREEGDASYVLVELDRYNFNESHMVEVDRAEDPEGGPALVFKNSAEGEELLGALTRAHLPEDAGQVKYRLAIIVEGEVRIAPYINSEVRSSGIITGLEPEEVERLHGLINARIDSNSRDGSE